MTQYKTCLRCKQTKPFNEFGKNRTKTHGLDGECLICRRISRAEYRERHVAKIKKEQADYYRQNREKRIAYANARVYANIEKHKEYNRISKQRNRLAIAANTRRRNARKRANGIYIISKKELQRLANSPCFYCGIKEHITIDHVIAIARGGTDSIGNLVAACKSCNSQKRQLTIMEWRKKKEVGKPTHLPTS